MAQRVKVELVDDLDGTEIADGEGQTVTFGFGNVAYEIDLTNDNAKVFEDLIKPYINAGRRLSAVNRGRGRGRTADRDYDPAAVRAWAKSQKIDVPARGRIPGSVVEQFKAAGH